VATESFSLVVANLFVGMLKNHRFLPSGLMLGHLGYDLFRLEPAIIVADGHVTPDAIATSPRQGHALVGEWTADVTVAERKRQQVAGYANITSADLITYGVPPGEARAFDVWLVVPPEGTTSYAGHLQEKGYPFALASFRLVLPCESWRYAICLRAGESCARTSQSASNPYNAVLCNEVLATDEEPGYELAHVQGEFSNSASSGLLRPTWHLERIPRGYLPFSLDDLSDQSLSESIAQQLVAFSIRGTHTFTRDDLCKGILPVWERLDIAKRSAVARAVLRVLNSWSRRGGVASWLKRIGDSPPTWQIFLPTGLDRDRFRRALRSSLTKVQRDIAYGQDEFPIGEEGTGGDS